MPIRTLIVAGAAVAALALPASASAGTSVLVAVGSGGKTQCNITVKKSQPLLVIWGDGDIYDFSGTTDCTANVEQTGQASLPGSPTELGPLCSGLRMTCSSSGSAQGSYPAPAEYHVTLTAPAAQVWLGSPTECTGVSTSTLDCTFTSQNYLRAIST